MNHLFLISRDLTPSEERKRKLKKTKSNLYLLTKINLKISNNISTYLC